jgi:hypothetical protein
VDNDGNIDFAVIFSFPPKIRESRFSEVHESLDIGMSISMRSVQYERMNSTTVYIGMTTQEGSMMIYSEGSCLFQHSDILIHILSFVGEYQFCFVATVNHSFYDCYVKLFPEKETNYNVTTTENMFTWTTR